MTALLLSLAAISVESAVQDGKQTGSPSHQILRDGEATLTLRRQSNNGKDEAALEKRWRKYQILELNTVTVGEQVRRDGRLTIQTAQESLALQLEQNDLLSARYRAEEVMEGGAVRQLSRPLIQTFKGQAEGRSDVVARLTIKDKGLEGLLLIGGEKYFIEPLDHFSPTAKKSEYIYYSAADVIEQTPGTCGVTLDEKVRQAAKKNADPLFHKIDEHTLANPPLNRQIELATEADYEYTNGLGGSEAANAQIVSIMNQVEGIYQNDLGISFKIVYQHTWAANDDPYQATASDQILTEFKNYWSSNLANVNRDLAHMWTGKDMDGQTIGVSYLETLCQTTTYAYGVSQNVFNSDIKINITAHEIGHSLGATHPDKESSPPESCVNTIMQSQVGYARAFCQFSQDQINTYVSAHASCLTPTFNLSGRLSTNSFMVDITLSLSGDGISRKTVPDNSGNYVFRGLTPGTYTVTPSRPYYVWNPPSRTVTVTDSDVSGVDFTGALINYSISGRVAEANNQGAPGVQVTLWMQGSIYAQVKTDANGNYVFANAPATRDYQISPYSESYYIDPIVKTITTLTANQTDLNFTATKRPPPPPTPTPPPPPQPPPAGVVGNIVFIYGNGAYSNVYRMNANGTKLQQLTTGMIDEKAPEWSPDGSKIAFSRQGELFVMNADGSGVRKIVLPFRVENPTWSPDGKKLMTDNFSVLDADGSNLTRIPVDDGGRPKWSPDGKRLVYMRGPQIWMANADGGGQIQMTNDPNGSHTPRWSPDGSKVVFVSQRDGYLVNCIYVMNADGSNQTKLTSGPRDDTPAFSPDGTKIAFSCAGDICVMDADGRNPRKVTYLSGINGYARSPTWKVSTIVGAPATDGSLILLTELNSARAAAIESTTSVVGPFLIDNVRNLSPDARTRVSLFALNVSLLPSEDMRSVTVEFMDSQQRVFPSTVEFVSKVQDIEWLTEVVVKLPDELAGRGDVEVRLKWHGATSNKAILTLN